MNKETLKYFNRDISWLSFNYRVLMEAQDKSVPLFERIKFLAIYSSNLDEFYRVRVANIRRLAAINKKKLNNELSIEPKQLLLEINEFISQQLSDFGSIWRKEIIPELKEHNIVVYQSHTSFIKVHKTEAERYFKTYVLGMLVPTVLQSTNEKQFLNNGESYLALRLKNKETQDQCFGFLNIPSSRLGRFVNFSKYRNRFYTAFLDDVIRAHLDYVFPVYDIIECKSIKLNKDADLLIDDEFSGDIAEKIEKQIEKRNLGTPARFLYESSMSNELLNFLINALDLDDDELVRGGRYHNLNDFFQLKNPIGRQLENPSLPAIRHKSFEQSKSMFDAIDEKDQMLHFPYHSYAYVLQFFNQAATDPSVEKIKVTFYRMASNSMIGEALISAAKNGKKVSIFMELKARFDEENNLRWSDKMRKAGIKVYYSLPGIKVHAKTALVKRKVNGMSRYYGFFGTGNLNEKTSKIYADHAMFSSREELTGELNEVFKYLMKRKEPQEFNHLLVSQFNIVSELTALIDHEIQNAEKGLDARIIVKINNLEDKKMISKLYEASSAGVKIDLIVRGICCLVPQLTGLSENINVIRIVDRYLEHARVFIFHNNGHKKYYLGSADWMKRNLRRRIEVVFPVFDLSLQNEVQEIIDVQLSDNVKATILDAKLNNHKIVPENGDIKIRSQVVTYNYLKSL